MNTKDIDGLLLEVLSQSPHISGISNNIQSTIALSSKNDRFRSVCDIYEISTPMIKEIQMEGISSSFQVSVDVLIKIGQNKIELHISNDQPLLLNGADKLSKELEKIFSYFEFDLSKMISVNDALYIAKPINGREFITWAEEKFFLHEEARRLSMLIISSLIETDPFI